MQKRTLIYIYLNPGCTQADADKEIPGAQKRFNELEEMGLIYTTASTIQDGKKRNTYGVTGETCPAGLLPKINYKKECTVLRSRVKFLEENIVRPYSVRRKIKDEIMARDNTGIFQLSLFGEAI